MDALSLKVRPWMRFNPPKDQVIDFFLRAKITGNDELVDFIPEAQCCKWEPWDLKAWLDSCGINTACSERWFFSPLDLKHRSGNRSNRATNAGFWKVTGKDKIIMSDLGMIGKKKYLVFYRGRGKGEKTNWKIHEYHTTLKDLDGTHPGQNAFVLCRLSYEHEKSIKDPNINDAGPAVSSPAVSKLFHEESESELLLASEFTASDVEATTTPENCDETISGTTTAVKCNDKHISAHAAGNQLGELTTINDDKEIEKMIIELQQIVGGDVLTPSTSLHNNPTVSSAITTKSSVEELESTLGLDVVSPQECFGGKTLNTILLSSCNQNSYNACAARNEVPKATVSEVDSWFEDGLSLFELPSEPPDGVYDLDYLNGNVPNMFGSQKNLTLESIKNNGSCGSLDEKLANAPFESTFQDSGEMSKRKASSGLQNSGDISKRKASSGLLNLEIHMVWMGGSSNQNVFQRIIGILHKMSLNYRLKIS
ncbi:NAC domain-containing protein 14-like isoform X4 [Juglans microcarpa x Juglans regia]|uniref:NAC domain-containing protein 14-like isoform X4 n=1 Tax=Juglans microcarpa x Juglans regia TaxID=2249226 RepID=UPI001B7F180B|nr:NAC domain-containing protein 14-like isoform X4 [Juglans microcarpa x Juglans regia]